MTRLPSRCRCYTRAGSRPRQNLCLTHRTYLPLTCARAHLASSPTHLPLCRDTIKLTALFTARRGRTFLASLSAREGRNYQFDFLRPTHTLFGYFSRLVEQYTKVLLPPKETLDNLSKLATNDGKWKILEVTREYAEWERIKREREKKRQDDREAERSAWFRVAFP